MARTLKIQTDAQIAKIAAREAKALAAASAPVAVTVSLTKSQRGFARAFYAKRGDTSHERNSRWLTMRADCYHALKLDVTN
jgi:hypothetical protein